jgi:hypothetical protein
MACFLYVAITPTSMTPTGWHPGRLGASRSDVRRVTKVTASRGLWYEGASASYGLRVLCVYVTCAVSVRGGGLARNPPRQSNKINQPTSTHLVLKSPDAIEHHTAAPKLIHHILLGCGAAPAAAARRATAGGPVCGALRVGPRRGRDVGCGGAGAQGLAV